MKKFLKNKWIRIGFGLAVVIFVAGIYGLRRARETTAQVTTAQAAKTSFTRTVQSSGKIKAKKSADLAFQTPGRLAWVGVGEGDRVAAGQAIAALDAREVEKQLAISLRNYSKQRNDYETTANGRYNPDEALSDAMKRILQNNQWDLDKAVLDVELKNLAVEYATLVSPIAGVATRVDTPVAGVNVTPTSAVFTVVDPATLVFEAVVDETDVGALSLGQNARVTLDAFPDATFSGRVSYIAYAAVTSSGGATVFPVEVTVAADKPLRVGLNGDVTITTETQNNVVVVPVAAVREDEQGSYVYKKTGGSFRKTRVTLGGQNENDAVVSSGLSAGDTVVIKGFSSLR